MKHCRRLTPFGLDIQYLPRYKEKIVLAFVLLLLNSIYKCILLIKRKGFFVYIKTDSFIYSSSCKRYPSHHFFNHAHTQLSIDGNFFKESSISCNRHPVVILCLLLLIAPDVVGSIFTIHSTTRNS